MPRRIDARAEDLFERASALSGTARAALLAQECADDPELRADLESLLAAHDGDTGPLDQRDALLTPADDAAPGPAPEGGDQGETLLGRKIGPWKVTGIIGTGGAGAVYAAQRDSSDFEQRVAIKVLRGSAAEDVERFVVERRILAGFEHPNIARLLDGGVLADGRPYGVMDFVDGVPLTVFAREQGLDLAARLALFEQVLDAVEYSHRNLIVHRDIKPANVLVNRDGRVKLLDFGIAKRLESRPPADDAETRAPLTLDYAAPEQLTGQAITTTTDIYGLGVVLFELLTGQRPLKTQGLPMARSVHRILEEPAPSLRAAAAASAPGAAALPPTQLDSDLEAIVATCLRKNPAERYSSVDALRADLERRAQRRPIRARPATRRYLVGRFITRHRWGLAATVLVFASALVALSMTLWQVRRVAEERDVARRVAAREEAVRYYLVNMFRSSISEIRGENESTKAMLDRSARRVLSEYRDDPQLAGQVVESLADLYGALQDVDGQVPLLEGFLAEAAAGTADAQSVAIARQKLANLELLRGNAARADDLLRQAEAYWAREPARNREQRLEGAYVRGALQRAQGDLEGSIRTYRAAIADRIELSGRNHRETANLYNSLAISLTGAGRIDEALQTYRDALAIHAALGRSDDIDALIMLGNTGTLAFRTGRTSEAEQILERAFERQRAITGDSASVGAAMGLYGAALTARGRADEALPVLDDALAIGSRFTGPASPLTIQNGLFRVDALIAAGRLPAAREALDSVRAAMPAAFGANSALGLRARIADLRWSLAADRFGEVAKAAPAVIGGLRALGVSARPQLAQALVLEGVALSRITNPPRAPEAPLEEALKLRTELLWPGSWELAEARVHLARVIRSRDRARSDALLAEALPTLQRELGATHPLTRLAASPAK
jgi:non-specific serine/threonine protein kinase/serine/threonine-protein kinase